jgi:dihydrofolate synthase / folylpolyglutamate synthase
MNYYNAVDFLQSLTDYEKSPAAAYNQVNFDLRRISLLLEALGNPHRGRRTVHIAGTKGKGSTASMIGSILLAAGVNVGIFTSPHLLSWQERISACGRNISKADFARLVSRICPLAEDINCRSRFGRLTTFETLTALAFCYFREKGMQFQVLETGMGGRLDATNIIDDPEVCIVTSLSLDHTQILGDTLARIAEEKAGIIKEGCTVVSAPQPPEAEAVIEKKCRNVGARLVLAGRDITWHQCSTNLKKQMFTIKGTSREYRLTIPLLGDYQMENAALAIGAIEILQQKGVNVSKTQIMRGIQHVKWPARMQVLKKQPLVIADGAHNSYSLGRVVESIGRNFKFNKAFVIFGTSKDKDIDGMANVLSVFADEIILTTSHHPRAAKTDCLASIFRQRGLKYVVAGDAAESLATALAKATEGDLILATGSLFLAADVLSSVTQNGIRKRRPCNTAD